jgi:hypothetical protein
MRGGTYCISSAANIPYKLKFPELDFSSISEYACHFVRSDHHANREQPVVAGEIAPNLYGQLVDPVILTVFDFVCANPIPLNLRYSNSGASIPSQRQCRQAVASSGIGSPRRSETFCIFKSVHLV